MSYIYPREQRVKLSDKHFIRLPYTGLPSLIVIW